MVMDLENKVEELTQLIDELNTQMIDKEMKILNIGDNCHNLAKWLSHYLFYFSFSFLFSFYLDLLHKKGVQESVI